MEKLEILKTKIEKRIEVLELSKLGAEKELVRIINEKYVVDNYSEKLVKLALKIKELGDKIYELSSFLNNR